MRNVMPTGLVSPAIEGAQDILQWIFKFGMLQADIVAIEDDQIRNRRCAAIGDTDDKSHIGSQLGRFRSLNIQ